MLRLNIGCGNVTPTDWQNIDICWNARISQSKIPLLRKLLWLSRIMPKSAHEVRYNGHVRILNVAKKGLPHHSSSVDCVYSSLFLDHLSDEAARFYLSESYRVLMPGGVIRTLVGDVYSVAKEYVERTERMRGAPPPERNSSALDHLEHNLLREYIPHTGMRWYHQHCSLWDENKLCSALAECGFAAMERKDFCDSRIPNIKEVEKHSGHLIMEAVKPR